MRTPLFSLIIKSIGVSFYFPVGMGLLGLTWDTVLGGIGKYLNQSCSGFNDCVIHAAFDYLNHPKTWKLLLLCWGIGLVMVSSMVYQNLKPEIHQWFRKFK